MLVDTVKSRFEDADGEHTAMLAGHDRALRFPSLPPNERPWPHGGLNFACAAREQGVERPARGRRDAGQRAGVVSPQSTLAVIHLARAYT